MAQNKTAKDRMGARETLLIEVRDSNGNLKPECTREIEVLNK